MLGYTGWLRNAIYVCVIGFFASVAITPSYIAFFQPHLLGNPMAGWFFTGLFTVIILGFMWVLGWWDRREKTSD